jgi:DNA-binding Lrp family transcriptional regulator
VYNRTQANDTDSKCTIVENSTCPQCKGLLMLDKLPDSRYYLKCTKCSWDSASKAPTICFTNSKSVLKEGQNQKILKRAELCSLKLKKNKGIDVCPNCLVQFLKNGHITSFSTIQNMFNLGEQTIPILTKLKNEKRVSGFIDSKNSVFVFIPDDAREFVRDEINNKGKISLEGISSRFDIQIQNATELMFDLLKEYQIHGTFDNEKKNYYTADFITNWLISNINEKGRTSNKDLAQMLNVSSEIIKFYAMELLKAQKINAYFADNGNEMVTKDKLKTEIKNYATETGMFRIEDVAVQLKVAVELIRRTIFTAIQEKSMRGIFTQKREFITEQDLLERIKGIAKAYRTIKLRELARKLGITEVKVVEVLEHLISHGAIRGFIDMNKHEFTADVHQPTTMGEVSVESTAPVVAGNPEEGQIEVVREYDFVGGQLHFKVVTRNNSDMAIHDIKIILDVPTSYNRKSDIITVAVIDPHNSRGVDFYLEPQECGISTIGGTVIYKDARGHPNTIHINPKDVQIKCPLVVKTLDRIEDCQSAIQTMPSDARAFLIADLDPQLAYRAGFRAITNFETRNVTSMEIPEEQGGYKAEAWFSSEAKVTGGRIITRVAVDGPNQSMEIRVWCSDPGQLTGFLAKIIELLFTEINMVRKIKSESRQKTLDVMSITQNLITASDYCAVRYDAREVLLKMEDTHARMKRVVGENDPTMKRIEYWVDKLKAYSEEDKIKEDDAEALMSDIEGFQNALARSLAP